MSSFLEVVYFVSFFCMFALTLGKIYNSITGGDKYQLSIAWFMFISFIFLYGISIVIQILSVDNLTFSVLQIISNFLAALQLIFLVIEHLYFFNMIGQELTQPRGRYNAKQIQEKI